MKERYDIAIIGSGPGGYVAALHAAHLGKSVCLIEKGAIGGTCLNRGCIPTKAYAASRDIMLKVQKAADFGIDVSSAGVDFKAVFNRKNEIVKKTRMSVVNLLKGNGVDIVRGKARLTGPNIIEAVNKKDGARTTVTADNIVIATGSKPMVIPALKIDHETVLTSNDVLKLEMLPKDMVIIGGGIIGCEFGSIFSAFGVKVTIVEMLDTILPTVDPQIVSILKRRFKKDGISVMTGVKVEGVIVSGGVTLTLSNGEKLVTEKALVSVGRAANTSGIGLLELGIKLDGDKIVVDDECRTDFENVFAIGDVTPGPMLAHKASHDAIRTVNSAFGLLAAHNEPFENVPSVIFTSPEIAYVGLSEKEAEKKSIEYVTGRVFYASSSKALCMGETDGLIKIVAKKESGVIIGAAICGAHASDLIYGLTVAISRKMKAKEVYETIFSHPTLSELVKEAAEDIDGVAVHKIVKTKS